MDDDWVWEHAHEDPHQWPFKNVGDPGDDPLTERELREAETATTVDIDLHRYCPETTEIDLHHYLSETG